MSASKISSELIPEEEHESSIIDEMLPSGTLESQGLIKSSINPFTSYNHHISIGSSVSSS